MQRPRRSSARKDAKSAASWTSSSLSTSIHTAPKDLRSPIRSTYAFGRLTAELPLGGDDHPVGQRWPFEVRVLDHPGIPAEERVEHWAIQRAPGTVDPARLRAGAGDGRSANTPAPGQETLDALIAHALAVPAA